jgi:hypothetical protein
MVYVLLAMVLQAPPQPPVDRSLRVASPATWIAFSADVKVVIPGQPERWGRHVQDEHGCRRQEVFHPDGSSMITLLNFQTQRMYRLFRGAWTSQPMKIGPVDNRRPYSLSVTRKAPSIEGFDAYVHESNVRGPRGNFTRTAVVIPALNFFEAVTTTFSGETRTAVNIRVEPQLHDQFLPPRDAAVAEQPGYGGFMEFAAVVLQIAFPGQPATQITTTEENAFALKTPAGMSITLVTSVTDFEKNIVRVRLLSNATGSPGNVKGDLIDEVTVALGNTAATTRLGETLTISVTRIGTRRAQ